MGVGVDWWIANDTLFIVPNGQIDFGLNLGGQFDGNNWARLSAIPQPNSPSQCCVIVSEYTTTNGVLRMVIRNCDPNNILTVRYTAIVAPTRN